MRGFEGLSFTGLSKAPTNRGYKMYTENIIRDIKELIYDTKTAWGNVYQSKRYAARDEDLDAAIDALGDACDTLSALEDRLGLLIEKIEMEALSAKVQSKNKTLSELFDEEESKK